MKKETTITTIHESNKGEGVRVKAAYRTWFCMAFRHEGMGTMDFANQLENIVHIGSTIRPFQPHSQRVNAGKNHEEEICTIIKYLPPRKVSSATMQCIPLCAPSLRPVQLLLNILRDVDNGNSQAAFHSTNAMTTPMMRLDSDLKTNPRGRRVVLADCVASTKMR
jgi:hypothetical protein